MSDHDKPSARPSPQAEREKRLAEALRANLKRRKVAAKSGKVEAPPAPAAPGGGKSTS
jgi:hypothetical protein